MLDRGDYRDAVLTLGQSESAATALPDNNATKARFHRLLAKAYIVFGFLPKGPAAAAIAMRRLSGGTDRDESEAELREAVLLEGLGPDRETARVDLAGLDSAAECDEPCTAIQAAGTAFAAEDQDGIIVTALGGGPLAADPNLVRSQSLLYCTIAGVDHEAGSPRPLAVYGGDAGLTEAVPDIDLRP